MRVVAAWLVTVMAPAIARAHHPQEDETGFGTLALWIAPALGLAVLALLQWIAARRRRRDDSDDNAE